MLPLRRGLQARDDPVEIVREGSRGGRLHEVEHTLLVSDGEAPAADGGLQLARSGGGDELHDHVEDRGLAGAHGDLDLPSVRPDRLDAKREPVGVCGLGGLLGREATGAQGEGGERGEGESR